MDCSYLIQKLSDFLKGSQGYGEFTRELFANIYEHPKGRNQKTNPINTTSVETFKGYYFSTPIRQLAKKIMPGLCPSKFENYINQYYSETTRTTLARYFCPVLKGASANNIGKKLAEQFAKCIESAALGNKAISDPDQIPLDLHSQLLIETNYRCPVPFCRNTLLTKTESGSYTPHYEVKIINQKLPKDSPDNLIAICPDCAKHFDNTKDDDIQKLQNLKSENVRKKSVEYQLSLQEIEDGVEKLLRTIQNHQIQIEKVSTYTPVEISRKIPARHTPLMLKTTALSATYYNVIVDISKRLSATGEFDFEEFRKQIVSSYLTCKEQGLSHTQVFQKLTDQICAGEDDLRDAAESIVAYFIQICEVFDALP